VSDEHHARVKALFLEACRRPVDARRKFLEQACGDDLELLQEVETLLLHHNSTDDREPTSGGGSLLDAFSRSSDVVPKTIGAYRVLQKLGEGGMGEVYEAEQERPVRRRVAVKLIKWGMDTKEVVARFESERQALALMNHPNIARVYEAGATEQGRLFFAMEYVPGVPITEYCDTNRLSTRERLALFIQVCSGIQHAHQKGVIHRDMKPSNVLVTIQDDRPVPKIIDFGVAKATSQRLTERTVFTELGQWIGTPEYMSPEQAEMTGLDIDTRTDVYSLGVVLYELLVGSQPFEASDLRVVGFDEMRRKIREDEPTRPSTKVTSMGEASDTAARNRRTELLLLARELRGDLDWITMRALEKDRTRRYGSPAELAADIERHLRHEPVLAGPPSTLYRVRKFIRRHRLGVGAGVLVLMALLTAIIGTTVGLLQARREAESARLTAEVLQQTFESLNPQKGGFAMTTREDLLDRGVATIETKLAKRPLVKARLMQTVGFAYKELGLYAKARELFEETIAIHREQLGEESPEYALSISFLGDTLMLVGDIDEAIRLHERALTIRLRALGPEDQTVSWTYRSLASAYYLNLEFDRARELAHQALAVGEKAVGPNHYDVSTTVDELARMEMDTGHYRAARPLFERALRIREETRGAEHPDVAFTLSGLGRLLYWMGDYERSGSMLDRVQAIVEKAFSPDHPIVAPALVLKADLLVQLGRYSEARDLYERAIGIQERVLGPEHIDTLQSLHGLGVLKVVTHEDDEARAVLERARNIVVSSRERSRGTRGSAGKTYDNSYFASVLSLLGVVERRAGETDQARVLHERSVEIFQDMFGPDHPYLGWPLNRLGDLHRDEGNYETAKAYLERALEIREAAYGKEHAVVAESLHSLAVLQDRLGNDDESRDLFERSLAMVESTLDPNHTFVVRILKDYAVSLRRMGETGRAGELEVRARAIEVKTKESLR
jgi:non-specific serine/threonine protein kinase/serine/threonine-protein kinase